ncbi:hypothetical protein [Haloferula sp. A504]|jgi:hypothetical protein|uniref:hypothetical protein n=1 Tax=Haloferula sp. A504 TaxID=3373601 RepID=UPI0031BDD061|nr:hypothetical protein [Verrucomicrobiaceae bacterium E54]
MKRFILPLITLLLALPTALANGWVTLSGIGDRIELKKGEVALLVSASEPSYVIVEKPDRQRLAMNVRPDHQEHRFFEPIGRPERDDVIIGWQKPFPVAGPCVIELRTPAALTIRTHGRPAQTR